MDFFSVHSKEGRALRQGRYKRRQDELFEDDSEEDWTEELPKGGCELIDLERAKTKPWAPAHLRGHDELKQEAFIKLAPRDDDRYLKNWWKCVKKYVSH